jgi:site-specific recombinase XerD
MKGTIKVATINKKLAAVRSLLSHCVAEGYLDYSVASNIGKVKKDKENKASQSQSHTERVIGSDEVWKLIAAASTERALNPKNLLYPRIASSRTFQSSLLRLQPRRQPL